LVGCWLMRGIKGKEMRWDWCVLPKVRGKNERSRFWFLGKKSFWPRWRRVHVKVELELKSSLPLAKPTRVCVLWISDQSQTKTNLSSSPLFGLNTNIALSVSPGDGEPAALPSHGRRRFSPNAAGPIRSSLALRKENNRIRNQDRIHSHRPGPDCWDSLRREK
jgi:hypothetical protein